jgi:hypothetical protein
MKRIDICYFCALLLISGCIANKPASYCIPPKEIHLGWSKILKIKRFIGEEEKMTGARQKYNIINEYCFDKTAVNSEGLGLISVKRRNVSHWSYHHFINGKRAITFLKFPYDKVSDTEDTIRNRMVLERALTIHPEIDDATKKEIRKVFWFYKKRS